MQKFRFLFFFILTLIFTSNTFSLSAQHDADTLYNVLVQYRLPDNFTPDSVPEDTFILQFHTFKPKYKHSISNSHLGNMGSANYSNVYFDRVEPDTHNMIFTFPYSLYSSNPQNIIFYDTRRPYTKIFHSSSSKLKDDQTLSFTHTQNVNPFLNLGVDYRLISSLGEYPNQQTKSHTIILHGNYTKGRYKIHAALTYNSFRILENGGVIDTGFVDLNALNTYLTNAESHIVQRNFFISQKYMLGKKKRYQYKDTLVEVVKNPTVSFGHSLDYGRKYRVYEDAEKETDNYYQNFYYTPTSTYDSIAYEYIDNRFNFRSEKDFIKKKHLYFNFMLSSIYKHYFNFKEYILLNYNSDFLDNRLSADVRKYLKNWEISGYAEGYISGYNAENYKIEAAVKQFSSDSSLFKTQFGIKQEHRRPDFFQQQYYSNHFIWDTVFEASNSTKANITFEMPRYSLKLKLDAEQIQNHVYYNAEALPAQFTDQIQIISVALHKDFHLKRFHFQNTVIWQKSSEPEIINIPEFVYYHGMYFKAHYQTHLKVHIGYEVYFTSVYKMKSYMPATGQFYVSNKASTGNYPFVNIYIDAKVKHNFWFFYKMENVTDGLLNDLDYSVYQYPIRGRIGKIGVKWTFKN